MSFKVQLWKWSEENLCVLIFHEVHLSLQAIKKANEKIELAKAAEQESAGPPVDTEPSDTLDTDKMPDLFLQPLRCVLANLILSSWILGKKVDSSQFLWMHA